MKNNFWRKFWGIFLIAALVFTIVPVKLNTKKSETKRTPVIYSCSNGYLTLDARDSNGNGLKTYCSAKGYEFDSYCDLDLKMSDAAAVFNGLNGKKIDAFIVNLGIGDYLNSSGIYSNEDNSIYESLAEIVTKGKANNENIKIYIVSNKNYDLFEEKNTRTYNYKKYHDAIEKFCENNSDVTFINLYDEDNVIEIDKTVDSSANILKGTFDEQREIIDRIISDIQ